MKKNVIFGAGVYGIQALKELGRKQVAYFLDNVKYCFSRECKLATVVPVLFRPRLFPDLIRIVNELIRFIIPPLKELGRKQVAYFLDNDREKQGTSFQNIPVISVEEFLVIKHEFHVVIASLYARDMAKQLDVAGITDYSFFS